MEQLAREEKKQPVLDKNQSLFEWLPGKEIEDYQRDPIIQEEEEPQENEIDQRPEREEEKCITNQETIGDKEEEQYVSGTNYSVEDIIDDLNESRYDNVYIDDSETEVSETNDTEMDENASQFEDTPQPQQGPNRENSG